MMNFQNIKTNFVKILIGTLGLILSILIVLSILSAISGKRGEITATGECVAKVDKDRTAINLNIRVLDKNSGTALKSAQQTADGLINFAKTLNDPSLQMQTLRLESYEKTEWNNVTQKSVSLGYETTIVLEISSTERQNIEHILSNLPSANVYPEGLRMYSSPEKLKPAIENCLAKAVENARNQASKIANADGAKIGKMISAQYGTSSDDGNYRPIPMMAKMDAESVSSGLVSKDSEITISVTAAFQTR